jgi:hypothetical protein
MIVVYEWSSAVVPQKDLNKYSDSDLAASVISLSLIWWSWDDDSAAAFRGNKS